MTRLIRPERGFPVVGPPFAPVVGFPKKGAVLGRTAPFSLGTYGQETEQLFPFVLSEAKRSRRTRSQRQNNKSG